MSEVKINSDRLSEAKKAAASLESSIKGSYKQCEELISYTHAATWSGKARDSFLTYLEIIFQYHKDLKEAAALQTKALNNLEGYFNDFNNDGSVRKVRNL